MWYTGRTVCGFDADDAPRDRHGQTVGAGRLLLATLATCVAFGAMWATASLIVVLETSAHSSGGLKETPNYTSIACFFAAINIPPLAMVTEVRHTRAHAAPRRPPVSPPLTPHTRYPGLHASLFLVY